MAHIRGILETALYVEDPVRSALFYRSLLGATLLASDDRLTALEAPGGGVLLLFNRHATGAAFPTEGGTVPSHGIPPGAAVQLHIAFASAEQGPGAERAWEEALAARGIDVESRIRWPRGGLSLYFRDPDQHSVEIVIGEVWALTACPDDLDRSTGPA